MIVTVFGASGKVGRLVVGEALARGHTVRAFVHRTNGLAPHPLLTIEQGDIYDVSAVSQAVHGSEAVISTLGSWGSRNKDVVSTAIRHIIPAMNAAGIDRIISLTGADSYDVTDTLTFSRRCWHSFARLVAGKILADGEEHIRLLRASALDWTVIRSPAMTNSARIFYTLSMRPVVVWKAVPRRAISKAIVDQLDGASYSNASPFIHSA